MLHVFRRRDRRADLQRSTRRVRHHPSFIHHVIPGIKVFAFLAGQTMSGESTFAQRATFGR